MGQIKNKGLYPLKDVIVNSDFFVMTDSENEGKTVSAELKTLIEAIVDQSTGNIVLNNPDEEDLTSVATLLKFKDRLASGNQVGYRIIRADFDWENIPSDYADCIWELRYEYDLNNGNIVIPDNVFMYFNGGYVSNYTSITGNNTIIDNCRPNGFDGSGTLDPSFTFVVCFTQDDKDKLDGIETSATVSDLGYTASPTNGTITNTGGDNATIPSLDNTNAGLIPPIQTITDKPSAVVADRIIIADSEDSNNPKSVELGNLPASLGTTNLGYVASESDGTVTSDTGTDATIPLASTTPNRAGLFSGSEKDKLLNIQSGAEVNVQSDWNQTNTSDDSYIKNKPFFIKGSLLVGDIRTIATSDPITVTGDFISSSVLFSASSTPRIVVNFSDIGTSKYQPLVTIKTNSTYPPVGTTFADSGVSYAVGGFTNTNFQITLTGNDPNDNTDIEVLITLIKF
jgi:hypothetical protein